MATKGNILLTEGIPQIKDAFVVIIKTEWNTQIVNALVEGSKNVLVQNGASYKVITVPGAVEIPFAVKAYAQNKQQPADAFITLGAVIKGDTPHFDYVCKMVTDGVLSLNLTLNVPVIFGVLTVDSEAQALERTGGKHGNKGEEAAIAAIKMIALNRELKK